MQSIYTSIRGSSMELDIHGMTVRQAKKEVQSILKTCPRTVHTIDIIHGYNRGNALQQYVRNVKHPKIEKVIVGLNDGKTTWLLR